MKIYFAPLEGITTYIFRNAYNEIYGHIDKYFAPFIAPSEKSPLAPRELRDISPENNREINLIPQILTSRSDCFIAATKELQALGYKEINLNLGCPSGTVCGKGRGSGFLQDTDALRKFLDDIYSYGENESLKLSIKTRIGFSDPDEFYKLMEIFNCFPVSELIVHPRIRSDFYKGEPRKEYFFYALEHSNCPVVYNGNIFSVNDLDTLLSSTGSSIDTVMLGRGLISDPSLADMICGNATETDFGKFRRLHDSVYNEYKKVISPDINILYKMKELWSYWQTLFEGREKDIKKLLKAKKCSEYEAIANRIL